MVVEGAPAVGRDGDTAGVGEAVEEVTRRVAGGLSRRDAIAAVVAETGLPRNLVYDAVVSPRASS